MMTKEQQTEPVRLETPLTPECIANLRDGDEVRITGELYAIHEEDAPSVTEKLEREEELPFSLDGQILYLIGPAPPHPPPTVGAPVTDSPLPLERFFDNGLSGIIAAGLYGEQLTNLLQQHTAVCFTTPMKHAPQAGASIKNVRSLTDASGHPLEIRCHQVEGFPASVAKSPE